MTSSTDKAMKRLSLEWCVLKGNRAALIFDAQIWALYEDEANRRGVDAQAMIAEAVVGLLGGIVYRRAEDAIPEKPH